jgi:hypothetical protein
VGIVVFVVLLLAHPAKMAGLYSRTILVRR